MSTPALNPLVEKIRGAHPGVYDDMDDAMLTKKVLAKYPQYSDLAGPGIQPPKERRGEMETSGLGTDTSTLPNPKTAIAMSGDDPSGFTGGAISGLALGGAAALGGSRIPGVPAVAHAAVKAAPYIAASEGINLARQHLPLGKYIPPGAELVPFFFGGGKKPIVPPAEAEASEAATAAPKPTPQIAGPSQYPPVGPTLGRTPPAPSGFQALREDQATEEGIREAADREDALRLKDAKREWFSRNQPGTPKGLLVEQAGGTPEKPVKFTKTPGVNATIANPSPASDLTPILEQSVKAARKKRAATAE